MQQTGDALWRRADARVRGRPAAALTETVFWLPRALASHGKPVLTDGRAALPEALGG